MKQAGQATSEDISQKHGGEEPSNENSGQGNIPRIS